MFMSHDFDMSSSLWTQEDLTHARDVYRAVFERVASQWPDRPVGPLARRWRETATPSVGHCIHVARMLHELSKGVTSRSVPIFHTKIKELLYCPDDVNIYEERLTEVEFGAYLSGKHSPVALEPLVPSDLIGASNPPKSPDYAIRLPHGDVFFDVTVLYVKMLSDWERVSAQLERRLSQTLERLGISRSVTLDLPLTMTPADGPRLTTNAVLRQLGRAEQGQISVPTSAGDARISWTTFKVFQSIEEAAADPNWSTAAIDSSGAALGRGLGVSRRPTLGGSVDVERHLQASLQNTIKGKREQFPRGQKAVIVMRLGNAKLAWFVLGGLLTNSLFRSRDNSWLSGVLAFSPLRQWNVGQRELADWTMFTNPQASTSLAQEELSIFGVAEGQAPAS